MKKTLDDYQDVIRKLPIKDKYDKKELLIEELLIEKSGTVEIYYAPHNEYLNPKAKIFIIGITPGFSQMSTAISTARKELALEANLLDIQYKCKVAARFSGSLRKNIINMLDEIKLNDILNVSSSASLFEAQDDLIHTVSLIPYPVFVRQQNYSGHTPKLLGSPLLMKYIYDNFITELHQLDDYHDVLLIPLGKAVEEVLVKLAQENLIHDAQILKGFPHPSGANVNRVAQLKENKELLIEQLTQHFNKLIVS